MAFQGLQPPNMNSRQNQRPLVPSAPATPLDGNLVSVNGGRGAKNHWVHSSCLKDLKICTINARTLRTDEKLLELEHELQDINWDIVGICETKRKGENLVKLESGNTFYCRGMDNASKHGVGFLIKNHIADRVISYTSINERIAKLRIQLSKMQTLQVIQVYAPTSQYSDEEIDEFYEEITKLMKESKDYYSIVMGDFNAKVGKKEDIRETCMGNCGIGQRNDRGDRLIEFAELHRLRITNTFFKKKEHRKWTWKSPNWEHKNEIDYILCDKNQMVKDTTVLSKFDIGSDHRMVRTTIKFNLTQDRKKKVYNIFKKIDIEHLKSKTEDFQINLANKFAQLTDEAQQIPYDELCETTLEAAKKIGGVVNVSRQSKLTKSTQALLKKRKEMKKLTNRNKIEYAEICKTISKKMKTDLRDYNTKCVKEALEKNKSIKKANKKLIIGKQQIIQLKEENGDIITDRSRILERIHEFYQDLYSSKENITEDLTQKNDENVEDFTTREIEHAMQNMKNGKAPGPDNLTTDVLKCGGAVVIEALTKLFNKILRQKQQLPSVWNNANVIILFKKGDAKDLKNYRPISLLSHTYKLFTKILTNRISKQLDENQPMEQAGFRQGFSTMDHLHAVNQVIEKTREYQIPLCLAFIDYEKAFDSIETKAVIQALRNQRIENTYVNLLTKIYNHAEASVYLDEQTKTDPVFIRRGVRQGDTISPKLFTAALEEIFKNVDWEEKGINVNGKRLNHLRFADDIILISDNNQDIQDMMTQLDQESRKMGLKMNLSKTKIMHNTLATHNQIKICGTIIEHVEKYVYLGQEIWPEGNQLREVKRRTQAGWAAFQKHNITLMNPKIPTCLKRKIFEQCIMPAMTYGSETWTLTKAMERKLQTTQRSMERMMLGYTRRDRKSNDWIRQKTKVRDIIKAVKEIKWRWAGHVARFKDERWTRLTTEWQPMYGKRKRERPCRRWRDELVEARGLQWMRGAESRIDWKQDGEAFAQQWDTTG